MRNEEGGRRKELIEFLKSKRWFGDKGREIREARVRDFVPVEWPNSKKPFAVSRVDVMTDAGNSTYQLFSPSTENGNPKTDVDALDDPEFLRGLADAWLKAATFEHDGVGWIIEGEGKTALVVPPKAPIAVSSAEQTNSSVVLNREAILKLYRRIEPGIHPDVEVTRFLTLERQFMHVPVLMGTVRFQDASGTTIAGMLQEYVQGATDGWTFALERLRAEQSRGGAKHQEGTRPFEKDAEDLGIVVRALHETLASGDQGSDFDLRPATPDDVRRWEQNGIQTMEAGLSMLERAIASKALPRETAKAADAIMQHRSKYAAAISALTAGIANDAGANTRTHGDLHLGQVLRSAAAQFLVIDFEGEPTRPLRERRARFSPLRDVAGMLRSFAYAAAAGGGSKKRNEGTERWENDARSAFLRCYYSETHGRPGLLPRSRDNADRLVRLFETEKAFYELQYELAHRPDWVWIPLRALTRLFQ
jgi:trehalose synthase-fused probable maltokinase